MLNQPAATNATTSLEIKTLEHVQESIIYTAFMEAFSDYLVPIKLSPEQFHNKLINEGVDLSLSAGAFVEGKLVGMVLNATGVWQGRPTFYNAGSGVVPAYRGQSITNRLFQYVAPELKKQGIKHGLLEVLQNNLVGINIYQRVGFSISRKLDCYKLARKEELQPKPLKGLELGTLDLFQQLDQLSQWHNWNPSWQNSHATIRRNKMATGFTALLDGVPVGYIVGDISTGRVAQFCVKPGMRGKGIGKHLFTKMGSVLQPGVTLSLINVDSSDHDTKEFLTSSGFDKIIAQYEMVLSL
jgi:ribosomal protein S18 acetylase RimI-like enzyme